MHLGKCVFSIDMHLERCIFNRNMHLPRCKSMKINRDGDEIRLKTMVKGQKKRVIPIHGNYTFIISSSGKFRRLLYPNLLVARPTAHHEAEFASLEDVLVGDGAAAVGTSVAKDALHVFVLLTQALSHHGEGAAVLQMEGDAGQLRGTEDVGGRNGVDGIEAHGRKDIPC